MHRTLDQIEQTSKQFNDETDDAAGDAEPG